MANRAGRFCPVGWLVFTLMYVVLIVSHTAEGELPLTALTGVCLAQNRPFSGPPCGLPALWEHRPKPRAHEDTHRPWSLSGALSCSERTDVYPTTFFFLGFVQCIKEKKKLFTLIIPFCCLCLFCFALFFFPIH